LDRDSSSAAPSRAKSSSGAINSTPRALRKPSASLIDRPQHFGDLPEAQSFSAIAFDSEGLKRTTPEVCALRLKLDGNIVRNSQSHLHDVYFLLLNFRSRS
jgi:hypothetical protein